MPGHRWRIQYVIRGRVVCSCRELLNSLGFEGRPRCFAFCKSFILENFVEVGEKGPSVALASWMLVKSAKHVNIYGILASLKH